MGEYELKLGHKVCEKMIIIHPDPKPYPLTISLTLNLI